MIQIELQLSTVSLCAFLAALSTIPPACFGIILAAYDHNIPISISSAFLIITAALLITTGFQPQMWWMAMIDAVSGIASFASASIWYGLRMYNGNTSRQTKEGYILSREIAFFILLIIHLAILTAFITFASTQRYILTRIEKESDLTISKSNTTASSSSRTVSGGISSNRHHTNSNSNTNSTGGGNSSHTTPVLSGEDTQKRYTTRPSEKSDSRRGTGKNLSEKLSQQTLALSLKAHHRSDSVLSKLRVPRNDAISSSSSPSSSLESFAASPRSPLQPVLMKNVNHITAPYNYMPYINNSATSLAFDSWDVSEPARDRVLWSLERNEIRNVSSGSKSSGGSVISSSPQLNRTNSAGFVESRIPSDSIPKSKSHSRTLSQYDRERLTRRSHENVY